MHLRVLRHEPACRTAYHAGLATHWSLHDNLPIAELRFPAFSRR